MNRRLASLLCSVGLSIAAASSAHADGKVGEAEHPSTERPSSFVRGFEHGREHGRGFRTNLRGSELESYRDGVKLGKAYRDGVELGARIGGGHPMAPTPVNLLADGINQHGGLDTRGTPVTQGDLYREKFNPKLADVTTQLFIKGYQDGSYYQAYLPRVTENHARGIATGPIPSYEFVWPSETRRSTNEPSQPTVRAAGEPRPVGQPRFEISGRVNYGPLTSGSPLTSGTVLSSSAKAQGLADEGATVIQVTELSDGTVRRTRVSAQNSYYQTWYRP